MPEQTTPEGDLNQGELSPNDPTTVPKEGAAQVASVPPAVARPAARFVLDPDDTSITNWNIQH